jgi:hypothetical protein
VLEDVIDRSPHIAGNEYDAVGLSPDGMKLALLKTGNLRYYVAAATNRIGLVRQG